MVLTKNDSFSFQRLLRFLQFKVLLAFKLKIKNFFIIQAVQVPASQDLKMSLWNDRLIDRRRRPSREKFSHQAKARDVRTFIIIWSIPSTTLSMFFIFEFKNSKIMREPILKCWPDVKFILYSANFTSLIDGQSKCSFSVLTCKNLFCRNYQETIFQPDYYDIFH